MSNEYLSQQRKFPKFRRYVYNLAPLGKGGTTTLGGATPFPYGEVYDTIWLEFYITITGTGTTARAEGELWAIKNILIKSDKHDVLVNCSGRSLFYRARRIMKVAPPKDAIATAAGTYKVAIPIHFTNKENRRPYDTALDMNGVNYFEVTITMGTETDLYTTVGTAVASYAVNITVMKSIYAADKTNRPIFQMYLYDMPPVDPTLSQNFEFEKTSNLGIMKLLCFTSDTTALAGQRFTGQGLNTIFNKITFEDNVRQLLQQIDQYNVQVDNTDDFLISVPAGMYILDLAKDNSLWSAYGVGGKSRVNLNWTNGAGAASGTQVSVQIEGVKTLRQPSAA